METLQPAASSQATEASKMVSGGREPHSHIKSHLDLIIERFAGFIAEVDGSSSARAKMQSEYFEDLSKYQQTLGHFKSKTPCSDQEAQLFADLFLHLCGYRGFPRRGFLKTVLNLLKHHEGVVPWMSEFYEYVHFAVLRAVEPEVLEGSFQTFRSLSAQSQWSQQQWKHLFIFYQNLVEKQGDPQTVMRTGQTLRCLARELDWAEPLWEEFLATTHFVLARSELPSDEFLTTVNSLAKSQSSQAYWSQFLHATRNVIQFGLASQIGSEWARAVRRHSARFDFDFLSYSQIESTRVFLQELQKVAPDVHYRLVILLGGGYGLLAPFLYQTYPGLKVRVFSIEPDEQINEIAEDLNKKFVVDGWKFKTITSDVNDVLYEESLFFLNRSDGEKVEICEHPVFYIHAQCEQLEDFAGWRDRLPEGALVALKGYRFHHSDHSLPFAKTIDEFKAQAKFSETFCERVIQFGDQECFLLIGRT
jgi:hypothetical protein